MAETNKILGRGPGLSTVPEIPIDSTCVRIGAMRCHSQSLTIKLRHDVPLDEVEDIVSRVDTVDEARSRTPATTA